MNCGFDCSVNTKEIVIIKDNMNANLFCLDWLKSDQLKKASVKGV